MLILADNALAELPDYIAALINLRTLDLGHNQLAELPDALGQLAGLTDYLYLHDNKLTALRESLFTRMIRLRYLNVSDNQLARLPDSIGNLWSLEELKSRWESADVLAHVVWRPGAAARAAPARQPAGTPCLHALRALPRLSYLDSLRGNPFLELPHWVVEWPNLQKLDLRWVRLSSVSPAIAALEERGCRVLL